MTTATQPAIKERPILFSGPMVRSILEGRKTQTRRVVRPQPPSFATYATVAHDDIWNFIGHRLSTCNAPARCPYGKVGDRLWVRETFTYSIEDGVHQYDAKGEHVVLYRADGEEVIKDDGDGGQEYRKDGCAASPWQPSIHMPRWASRINLEITGVRVERVQEISEADAKAEGAAIDKGHTYVVAGHENAWAHHTAKGCFETLWDTLNAERGFGWKTNPWVWVVEFKRILADAGSQNRPTNNKGERL